MTATPEKKPSIAIRAFKKLWKEPKFHWVMGTGSFLFVGLIIAALFSGITLDELKSWGVILMDFLGEYPLWLFLALVILPAFPIPASPLLILAGIVYGPTMGIPMACVVTTFAMLLNTTIVYWLAATVGHSHAQRLFRFLEIKLPVISEADSYRIALFLRITPGFPFFLQNIIMGFLRMRFRAVMVISVIIISLWNIGFVAFGGAIFEGKSGIAILALSLLVIVSILTSLLRRKLNNKVIPKQGVAE